MKKIINKYGFILRILLGSFILAFGMYNIHSVTPIKEGGILGLELLLDHWFNISPSITSVILDGICYGLGTAYFGKEFIIKSVTGTLSFSLFYSLLEHFPRVIPNLCNHLLLAAVIGAVFVGVGAGLVVKEGGAAAGDDALALVISDRFHIKLSTAYLSTDLTVLVLSLSYIPFNEIFYSIITVILSGKIIDLVQKTKIGNERSL